jgi:uncharacterized protein YjiS (DUF1127 family)
MTAIQWQAPRSRARQHNAVHALNDAAHQFVAALREWRRRAGDRARLAELDDRMLKDIGLTRADAEFLANKPFWKE